MEFPIYKVLQENEQHILAKWQSNVFSQAPHELLPGNTSKGQFTDPISYSIEKNTAAIFKWLIKAADDNDLAEALEEICRLSAVQNSKPSEALGFIWALKHVIHQLLASGKIICPNADDLMDVDARIDKIVGQAFDFYCACQAQIYELRFNEIKRMYGRDAG